MYGLNPNASAMTLPLADHPEINTGTAAVNQVTFTAPSTGVYYFGFNAYSIADQDRLFVDDIIVDAALSTPGFQQGTFSYYPNPVKDVLKLSYSGTIANVTVYNLLGQCVMKTDVNQTDTAIDMSRLRAGNYIVKITADTMTKTIKIIKE